MNRRLLVLCLAAIAFYSKSYTQTPAQPNIIFIILDDLNTYLSVYDAQPQMQTPHIKQIADCGTVFTNAFCNATECAPSRTSFLTGKLPNYTEMYSNGQYLSDFRSNFSPEKYILTFPQYLKDSAGYYTVSANKIFHEDQLSPDYDSLTSDPCFKTLSWSRTIHSKNSPGYSDEGVAQHEGVENFPWASMDSSWDTHLEDYTLTDSVIQFIESYSADASAYCNKPFFLGVGYRFPHLKLFVPENYFLPYYIKDFFTDTFDLPYNFPVGSMPYNGVVMPPQPEIPWSDYEALGYMGQAFAGPSLQNGFYSWFENLDSVPSSLEGMPDSLIEEILIQSKKANAIMAYMAAIEYVDAQIGRLYAALQLHPEILNNTIIVITSDHGYSLDQKRHWKKSALWETDIHIPLIISDFRDIKSQSTDVAVSLIDLFPTFCEFAGVSSPLSPDGTLYPDGSSLVPILENPDTVYNKPVTIYIENDSENKEGGCNPQMSVRTNSKHFIRYQSNGAIDDFTNCNDTLSFFEDEFYNIGENRNIDPNEWSNLLSFSTVADAYFSHYLPEHDNFLEFSPSIFIGYEKDSCSFDDSSIVLNLTATLYDQAGNLLIEIPEGKTINWYDTSNTLIGTGFAAQLFIQDVDAVNILHPVAYTTYTNTDADTVFAFELLNLSEEEINALMTDCATTALIDYEGETSQPIIIYPNPASNFINISDDRNELLSFRIYNILGDVMKEGVFESNTTVDLQNLPKGVYMIVFSDDGGIVQSEKLILQ